MQLEIMQNCAILSPDYFTPKDIIGLSMDIEKFMKENPEVTGEDKSNLDLMAEFLRGGPIPRRDMAEELGEDVDEESDDPEAPVRVI